MAKNLYQILGIRASAEAAEIKKAYRKLAKQYHPDTNEGNEQAQIRFREVKEAYETLSDPEKRKNYDGCQQYSSAEAEAGFKQNKSQARKPSSSTGNVHADLEKQFEHFFGYNPRTKEKQPMGEKGKNPMDTSDLFGSFFKMGKK